MVSFKFGYKYTSKRYINYTLDSLTPNTSLQSLMKSLLYVLNNFYPEEFLLGRGGAVRHRTALRSRRSIVERQVYQTFIVTGHDLSTISLDNCALQDGTATCT